QDWEGIRNRVSLETVADVARMYQALFRKPPWMLRLTRRPFFKTYTSRSVSSVLATIHPEDGFGDEELRALVVPTAGIWGEHDGIFVAAVGERMARALPRSRFYLIPEAGHSVQWEKPREFA